MFKLSQLTEGESAIIKESCKKLSEIGIKEGSEIKLIKYSLPENSIELSTMNKKVCLKYDEIEDIIVEKVKPIKDKVKTISGLFDRLIDIFSKIEIDRFKGCILEDLSYGEAHVLKIIGSRKDVKIFELSDAMNVTRPSMTATVDKLEKKEFVYKDPGKKDRRAIYVRLTEKGKDANVAHEKLHCDLAENFLEGLSVEEQNIFTGILKRIIEKMV